MTMLLAPEGPEPLPEGAGIEPGALWRNLWVRK